MFGPIGMPELIVIFLIALLIFGPRKLPEIGKSIGKGLSEFRRASEDLKRTIEDEIEQGKREGAAVRQEIAQVAQTLQAAVPGAAGTSGASGAETPSPPPDSRPIHPA